MLYLDTSLIVTLLTAEAETEKARTWMRSHPPGSFAVSDWVVTEFAAALSMKARARFLSEEQRQATQRWFDRLVVEAFERLPVERSHFASASRLARQSKSGLRGGDALHLAIAETTSAVLCTRDRGLHQAGVEFGIATLLI